MTGPEHYLAAERLLRDEYRDAQSIANAQVHATLALAAATALPQQRMLALAEYKAWAAVAAEKLQGDD